MSYTCWRFRSVHLQLGALHLLHTHTITVASALLEHCRLSPAELICVKLQLNARTELQFAIAAIKFQVALSFHALARSRTMVTERMTSRHAAPCYWSVSTVCPHDIWYRAGSAASCISAPQGIHSLACSIHCLFVLSLPFLPFLPFLGFLSCLLLCSLHWLFIFEMAIRNSCTDGRSLGERLQGTCL
jgi:hypothetical protein